MMRMSFDDDVPAAPLPTVRDWLIRPITIITLGIAVLDIALALRPLIQTW